VHSHETALLILVCLRLSLTHRHTQQRQRAIWHTHVCLHMFKCVRYICICTDISANMQIHAQIHVFTGVCTCLNVSDMSDVSAHVQIYQIYVHIYRYICMYTDISAHIQIHVQIHVCTGICTCLIVSYISDMFAHVQIYQIYLHIY